MKYSIFYIIIFLISVSCTKIIEVKLPEIEGKLVVNCLFTEGEFFKVYVGKSIAYLDSYEENIVNNASVEIFSDGTSVGYLPYNQDGFYYDTNIVGSTGITYSIIIEAEGFEKVSAQDRIPEKPVISKKQFIRDAYIDGEGDSFTEIILGIEDTPDLKNYYDITCYVPLTFRDNKYTLQNCISNDPVFVMEDDQQYYPNYYVFTDVFFNGEIYDLQLLCLQGYMGLVPDGYHVLVIVNALSETLFTYKKRWIKHHYNQNPDLLTPTEPVQMTTNITNGYGIFAGYNSSRLIFEE